jgi:dTDP-4-dehydrorhamnose 3,5-epimerase
MGDPVIDGVMVVPLRRIVHPRGDILHVLKRSAPGFVGFGEAYFSQILPGEIKGWKRHRRVTLNLVVPVGEVRFVIHDDRAASRTRGRFDDVILGESNYARLCVVPGLWMAFSGIDGGTSLILDITDEEHDPQEADSAELASFDFNW